MLSLTRAKCQLCVLKLIAAKKKKKWHKVTRDLQSNFLIADVTSTAITRPRPSWASQVMISRERPWVRHKAWCLACSFISPPHSLGATFKPLQMLVRAEKSMHSNRDKWDLVLDNSGGCLSVHYSLDGRDRVTTAASAGVYLRQGIKAQTELLWFLVLSFRVQKQGFWSSSMWQ